MNQLLSKSLAILNGFIALLIISGGALVGSLAEGEFIELAFDAAGFYDTDTEWRGEGLEEEYVCNIGNKWVTLVKINPKFFRPAEVDLLLGDSNPIRIELGW